MEISESISLSTKMCVSFVIDIREYRTKKELRTKAIKAWTKNWEQGDGNSRVPTD